MAVLEKIKLVIEEDRFIDINNPYGDKSKDYICKNQFYFDRGKIYGIVCEHGGGGEAISLLLSNELPLKQEKIYIDGVEAGVSDRQKLGWYVGKALYSRGPVKRELSSRKALEYAIKKYHYYEKLDDIVEEFHLTPGKLDYGLSKNCEWEKWRTSMAIGYASRKNYHTSD